jgi:hypothetical protein
MALHQFRYQRRVSLSTAVHRLLNLAGPTSDRTPSSDGRAVRRRIGSWTSQMRDLVLLLRDHDRQRTEATAFQRRIRPSTQLARDLRPLREDPMLDSSATSE